MVLMWKPSVVDAPSGGAPDQAPRWDLVDTKSCSGGIRFLAPVLILWGTWVYIGGRSTSVEHRGAHEAGGAPTPLGAPSTLVGPLLLHRRTPSSYIYLRTPKLPDMEPKL